MKNSIYSGSLPAWRHAFTLIELLVVVAVIAILAGLLLPTLAKARESGKAAYCRNNEKNLILAWTLYSQEHDSEIVGAHDRGKRAGDWVGPKQDEQGRSVGAQGSVEDEKRGFRDGLLWDYLEDHKVYHCLSDRRDLAMKSLLVNQGRAFRSYAIPCSMNGPPYVAGEEITRIDQLRNPSERYVFLEEDTDVGGSNWGGWLLPYPFTDAWWDPIAIRHDDKNSLAFADGHVETHRWLDPITFRMAVGQVHGLQAPGSPDLLYMQRGYAALKGNP